MLPENNYEDELDDKRKLASSREKVVLAGDASSGSRTMQRKGGWLLP